MKIKKAMLFLISILLIVTMSFRSMAYETDKSSDEEIISTIKDIILKFYENKDLV